MAIPFLMASRGGLLPETLLPGRHIAGPEAIHALAH
jgi:hypothetical protein